MDSEDYQELLQNAFRFLSIRVRSEKEVLQYLYKRAQKKSWSEEVVSAVFSRLKELEYVDDKKFAQAFVTGSIGSKPKGPAIIRLELKRKGVSEALISQTLSEREELHDTRFQEELGRRALGKKGELYRKLPILECKRKVHDFLLRRGFSSSIVHSLVDDYCRKA